MKKFILLLSALFISATTACLIELSADVNQGMSFNPSLPAIPFLAGLGTNLVAETGVSNEGQGVMGDYAQITELRLNWVVTNHATNNIGIAIGLTASSTVTNGGQQFTNFTSYHADTSKTAWIVQFVTLTNGQILPGTFVSTDVNPLLRDLLVASNSYQLVIQTYLTNSTGVLQQREVNVSFGTSLGMTLQRKTSETPGIISLFQ